jgi:hypothetical protein
MVELRQVVCDFADAFKAIDSRHLIHKGFQPGIGPFGEPDGVKLALAYLQQVRPEVYGSAQSKQYPGGRQSCDLVIDDQWAIEYKLIRPFGDNGRPAEHWSENVLHPYEGNTSAIGDCFKLARSGFQERKAIVVYGFEHAPPQVPLEPAVRSFEVIAEKVAGIRLGARESASFDGLVHPVHQQGKVYGWELLSVPDSYR